MIHNIFRPLLLAALTLSFLVGGVAKGLPSSAATLAGLSHSNLQIGQQHLASLAPESVFTEMTKFTRQYYRFVRLDAVRIEAHSDDGNLDPLVFANSDGRTVVAMKAATEASFSVQGLPPGTYGIKYTTSDEFDTDLPDITLNTGEALTTRIPAAGVITIYAQMLAISAFTGKSLDRAVEPVGGFASGTPFLRTQGEVTD